PEPARARQPRCEAAHAVSRNLRRAAIRIQKTHRRAARPVAVKDDAIGADAAVTLAHGARQCGAIREGRRGLLLHEEEIVAVCVRLDHRHLRQKATRCQPNRRTHARGSALNVPTKNVLNSIPFHPPCSRDFTGNRSSKMRTSRNPESTARNSAALYFFSTGASSCSRPTFISLESAFSQEIRL